MRGAVNRRAMRGEKCEEGEGRQREEMRTDLLVLGHILPIVYQDALEHLGNDELHLGALAVVVLYNTAR